MVGASGNRSKGVNWPRERPVEPAGVGAAAGGRARHLQHSRAGLRARWRHGCGTTGLAAASTATTSRPSPRGSTRKLGEPEAEAGWATSRVQRPVAILGRLDGIWRRASASPQHAAAGDSRSTAAGADARRMARSRRGCWPLVDGRDHSTRSKLRAAAEEGAPGPLLDSTSCMRNPGASPLVDGAVDRLARATPSTPPEVDLRTYRHLIAPGTTGRTWRRAAATGPPCFRIPLA